MAEKPVIWIGSSKQDLASFPEEARRKAGFQLRAVQRGEPPSDFKPMPAIGKGVEEIRIRTEDAFRIFYMARFGEAVYVLHAFQKKTQQTSGRDVELGQKRYQDMLRYRQQHEGRQGHE
jgi:phage-related protein